MIPNRPRYAARLNAFKLGLKNPTVPDLLARIAEVPGIDAADLPRVFDVAYRGSNDRVPRADSSLPSGSGLGLAIVKHNTELYGGTVRAESVLGQGATFIVTLPARSIMRIRR